jgi:NAD(P)H-hydrate repair Nnr-like enzyme with NAD(P)H-hydrate dehydratase domain
MQQDYWLKQTDTPLFPELEWSRPENKRQAGKLLIVGGNGYEFKAPANAYGDALAAGVGTAKVLLPASMQKVVQDIFPEAEFAPSTPSGSFAGASLAAMLELAQWADGVLLAGDIGRNSETTVLLETFLEKYQGQVTLTKDAADLAVQQPLQLLQRTDTLLVLAMGQLRRLGSEAHFPRAFTTDMGLVQLAENLHECTKRFAPHIITRHQDNLVVAANGRVSTTPVTGEQPVWRLATAASASTWWLQVPTKPFEALTTAIYNQR